MPAIAKASHGVKTRIGRLLGAAGSLSICQTIQLLLESSKPCTAAASVSAVTARIDNAQAQLVNSSTDVASASKQVGHSSQNTCGSGSWLVKGSACAYMWQRAEGLGFGHSVHTFSFVQVTACWLPHWRACPGLPACLDCAVHRDTLSAALIELKLQAVRHLAAAVSKAGSPSVSGQHADLLCQTADCPSVKMHDSYSML